MTAFSKFFAEHIRSRTCQELLHSESCRVHLSKDVVLYILSNLKYFAPVCLLPAVIKIRKINRNKVQKTLEYYLGCSVTGSCIGFSINLLMCLIRKMYGKFGYYSFVFIPTILGSNFVYLGSDRIVNLFHTAIFQSTIETFFLMRKNILSRTITNSKILRTCLFMACSAIILHVKQVYNAKGFWLLLPNSKTSHRDNIEECSKCNLHPQNTCAQYLIQGLRKYFILGVSLDGLKLLINHVTSTRNTSKFAPKLKSSHVRSTSLLTAYIGIYRFVNCWLNRKAYYSDSWNHILASFLAGACYYLYPQMNLFSFALLQSILFLWKVFRAENVDSKSHILRFLFKVPYARICFPFAVGILVHLTVLHPKCVSHFGAAIANGITNKYAAHIANELNSLRAKLQFERC